jgi:hypothetical protein
VVKSFYQYAVGLGLILGSAAFAFCASGDSVIHAPAGKSEIVITTTTRLAGAIHSLTWDGKVGVHDTTLGFADLTRARVQLDETRCWVSQERIPSKGERWAPYNRLYVVDPSGTPHGPIDNPDPAQDFGVPLERTVSMKWSRPFQPDSPLYNYNIWKAWFGFESIVRPVIEFLTDKEGLQLDLGDVFETTWTRGGAAGPYNTATAFRVEEINVDPETLAVGIRAVWVNDLVTELPYLLDDETLLVVDAGAGGRTVQVEDTVDTLPVSGTGVDIDDVLPGDILVLADATQANNIFSRFRQLRITGVAGDGSSVNVDDPDLDFDAASPVAVATWKIVRGATTYPDSSTDPTNYPNDGDMYGKACDEDDEYTDNTNANRLG